MSKKSQLNIRNFSGIFVRRKYKDSLFRRVFQDKKDLLDLYNALNNTTYDDPNELEITTLEDVIYLSMKNDVSFIVSSTLNLYEHQSTVNKNMPIRGLLYFARLYEAYIKINRLDIHKQSLISLPTPKYIVFYNGRDEVPDKQILKLSDAFKENTDEVSPVLECIATVLNINYGHNKQTLNACKRLNDYSLFISKVNEGLDNNLTINSAINEAMSYCIENDILYDILVKQESEVKSMLLTEFDKKLYRKSMIEEGYESRQPEVDALTNENNSLKLEIEKLKRQLAELQKV